MREYDYRNIYKHTRFKISEDNSALLVTEVVKGSERFIAKIDIVSLFDMVNEALRESINLDCGTERRQTQLKLMDVASCACPDFRIENFDFELFEKLLTAQRV